MYVSNMNIFLATSLVSGASTLAWLVPLTWLIVVLLGMGSILLYHLAKWATDNTPVDTNVPTEMLVYRKDRRRAHQ